MRAATAAFLLCVASAGHAQSYPAKVVRLIMPYPAGGATDTIGRFVAERLTGTLGQTVLVDNRPGASAQIGTEAAAKAPADGYTLVMATSTNTINQVLNPKLPYDFQRDLLPIALVAKAAQILVVHPSVPARTLREFISLARSRPGALVYSSSGVGTSGHPAMEALTREANIKLVHVPYKGNAPALNDLIGGQVAAGFVNIITVLPQVKAGRLRALGVSSAKRSALAPEVPTIAELGFPGFDVTAWFGVVAPAGTPDAVITRLNRDIVNILDTREGNERLLTMGVDRATIRTPREFADFIDADLRRWKKVVEAAGVKLEQ